MPACNAGCRVAHTSIVNSRSSARGVVTRDGDGSRVGRCSYACPRDDRADCIVARTWEMPYHVATFGAGCQTLAYLAFRRPAPLIISNAPTLGSKGGARKVSVMSIENDHDDLPVNRRHVLCGGGAAVFGAMI